MKIKQKVLTAIFILGFMTFLASVISPVAFAARCGGVETALISCAQVGGGQASDTGVWGILILAIKILTGGIGVLAIAGIVYGSIMYTTAAGSPEQVKKAIEIFRNVVIGIVAYALMFGFLNFIIPGGVFQ